MNAFTEKKNRIKKECVYKRVFMLWKNMLLQDIWRHRQKLFQSRIATVLEWAKRCYPKQMMCLCIYIICSEAV
jgi:hypothetical protein